VKKFCEKFSKKKSLKICRRVLVENHTLPNIFETAPKPSVNSFSSRSLVVAIFGRKYVYGPSPHKMTSSREGSVTRGLSRENFEDTRVVYIARVEAVERAFRGYLNRPVATDATRVSGQSDLHRLAVDASTTSIIKTVFGSFQASVDEISLFVDGVTFDERFCRVSHFFGCRIPLQGFRLRDRSNLSDVSSISGISGTVVRTATRGRPQYQRPVFRIFTPIAVA
jgi:hypothetical protein